MQIVGFAIPLTIAAPLYAILLVVFHETDVNFASDHLLLKTDDMWVLFAIFLVGWAGQFWLCRHVWFRHREDRMEFANKLFVLPHFCSPLVDLSLLHSRKKRNTSETERKDKQPNVPSKVYICATMWHENRIEMKKILISIFRYDWY
jgi:chitin synthase